MNNRKMGTTLEEKKKTKTVGNQKSQFRGQQITVIIYDIHATVFYFTHVMIILVI